MTKEKTMQHQQTFDFDATPPAKEPEHVATDTSLPPPLVRPDRQIVYPEAVTHYDWPDANELHDRDTITVDRITDDIDGPAHRFKICRGDTVEAYMGHNRFHVGVVIGISHARSEVRVAWDATLKKGGWFKVGAIYPAPEPVSAKPANGKPLSAIIEKLNRENAPPEGWEDRDQVPTPYTFTEFQELWKTRGKDLTYQSYRETFERVASSDEAIKEELVASYNAKQLRNIAHNLGSWDANRCTKKLNAQNIYDKMLSFFLLDGVVSFPMGETYLNAVKKKVRAVTEEDWSAHHAKLAEKRREHEEAITNPQTLLDFAKFIEAKGSDAMTCEQMARWDAMHADLARQRRAQEGPSKTVSQFESEELSGVEFSITQGYHTKRDCPLWIVQLDSRVERATFNELNGKAKMLGGRYSSFKRDEAGFQFFAEETANRFISLLTGDEDREDILAARKERKELSAAERLHELADTLNARAEETISASEASLQNTARRADIQAGVRGRAYADQALARSLHSVATSLSTGVAKYLDGVRHKTHLETLDTVLYLAKWARIRAIKKAENEGEYGYGLRVDEEEGKPYSEEDIRFAEYPHPYAYRSWLENAISHCQGKSGAKQASAKMAKLLRRTSSERIDFTNEYDIETFVDFFSRAQAAGFDTRWLHTGIENYRRLRAAKIDDLHVLRSALREYLPHKASLRGDDPVRVAERELIGKKLPGFFPTPKPVIAEMLEYADLTDGLRVLEPSCGKGDILDALKETGFELATYAIEQNLTLADVLATKGYAVDYRDFLTYDGTHDRVLMNPPFEAGADIDHVRHAYDCLAPGGRLVSVMSEGPFFRSDTKARDFREWLDQVVGESYELPANAFSSADAFRQTGVRTRLVVIDKP